MYNKQFLFGFFILFFFQLSSQAQVANRWQQRISYDMDIDFDVKKHQFKGEQKVTYFNNSPDTLNSVFYHLYFNAFQPNSMMDMRNLTLPDADSRVGNRISKLGEDEIGYHKILELKQNGSEVAYKVEGTILEVKLNKPILPNSKVTFNMKFESQVPVQIRRTGRDNAEGISYSMSQWYPKFCEYDYQGWHANPYVGREFHGVWGDFDVTIKINGDYMVAATGHLQNPSSIGGYGYEKAGEKVKRKKRNTKWRFKAENVHDFVWAADPDYTHTKMETKDGIMMHFFYQKGERTTDNWEQLPRVMKTAFAYINTNFGQYPYTTYSFIQGGDGGMEYPMATLITGERSIGSLVGVSVHELMHSWYQMVLGTNESLYAWMDEGFTSYASSEVMNYLKQQNLVPGTPVADPQLGSVNGYINFAKSGREEPLSTHADHFTTNAAYGVGSYVKGSVFLTQLEYIMGTDNFRKGLLRYFNTWKFKHPNPNDFIRIMEKQSGLELDWYKEYMVNTTHSIDYGVASVEEKDESTTVTLEKIGVMPMPLDVEVTYIDGTRQTFYIPLRIMRGEKPLSGSNTVLEADWPWTHPNYKLIINRPTAAIKSIEIDPSGKMADNDRTNNTYNN